MTRRKVRTGGAGLFAFAPDGDISPGEIHDNPLRRPCPYCHAQPGQRCTRPIRGGGRAYNRVHHPARTQPQETP